MTDGTGSWGTAAADAQRQLLQLIEQGQEQILTAVQQWRDGGEWRAPELPKIPGMETVSPEAVLRSQFEFAERVLSAQRNFAEQLLAAVRPTGK